MLIVIKIKIQSRVVIYRYQDPASVRTIELPSTEDTTAAAAAENNITA